MLEIKHTFLTVDLKQFQAHFCVYLLTFYFWPRLQADTSCHSWHWQCDAGPQWMGFHLHDNNNLCWVEGDFVEGQCQRPDRAAFGPGQGLVVGVGTRRDHPVRGLFRRWLRRGRSRRGFTGGVPRVGWQDFLQEGFGLLQLCQSGIDFQRTIEIYVQLGCGNRKTNETKDERKND